MMADRKYKEVGGMSFDENTPDKVCEILVAANKDRKRLKLFYGDAKTGKDWAINDTIGTIGKSTGRIPIPLLIKTARSSGGAAVLDSAIVKIRDAKTGTVLYQHPKYQTPKTEIKPSEQEGYTHSLHVNGELYSNHKDLKGAEKFKAKLEERYRG